MALRYAARPLSVLIYHRIRERRDPVFPAEVDTNAFEHQMRVLARWFHVLPLSRAASLLATGSLPKRAVSVTFDDGYADNVELALPILLKQGIPCTFFIATGFLDGGCMWNDRIIHAVLNTRAMQLDLTKMGLGSHTIGSSLERRRVVHALLQALKYLPRERRDALATSILEIAACPLPSNLMMRSDQVVKLSRSGMEIGAHTVNHPILAQCTSDEARAEISESRSQLEALTRAPVRLFAYPNGKPGEDYRLEHVALVREMGFDAAVSTISGAAVEGDDVFQLPRYTPWQPGSLQFMLRIIGSRQLTPRAAFQDGGLHSLVE